MHVFGGPPTDENPHSNKHQRVDVVKNLFSGMKINKFGQIDQTNRVISTTMEQVRVPDQEASIMTFLEIKPTKDTTTSITLNPTPRKSITSHNKVKSEARESRIDKRPKD